MKIILKTDNIVSKLSELIVSYDINDIIALQISYEEFNELKFVGTDKLTVEHNKDPAGNIFDEKYYFSGIELIVV